MGKLSDELSERARRVIATQGEQLPLTDAGPTGARFRDNTIHITLTRHRDDNYTGTGEPIEPGDEYLQIWLSHHRGFAYQERNGIPLTNTFHFINEIAVAVKHLRSIMLLDDLADGREPPPESILRDLDE